MHRSPAEPNAAAARWSAAKSTSASGRTIAWFFAPPRAWTRLPFAVARRWMYCAIGVEPTNETAATSGWSSSVSTASLSPCTTLKTPSGRPACCHSSATSSDAEGSRSLGLRTKALPQAIATGCIHIGTITGKLNGVMPATTPSGSRNEYVSTSGGDLVREVAFEQMRYAAGELDDLEPAQHLAAGVGEDLAVLAGDQLGQLVHVRR